MDAGTSTTMMTHSAQDAHLHASAGETFKQIIGVGEIFRSAIDCIARELRSSRSAAMDRLESAQMLAGKLAV